MLKWVIVCGLHVVWAATFFYLWNSRGLGPVEWDALTASMTALQTVIVVFGLVGFGYVAIIAEKTAKQAGIAAAKEQAKETATELTPGEVKKVLDSILPAMVRREVQDQLRTDGIIGAEKTYGASAFPANSLDEDKGK